MTRRGLREVRIKVADDADQDLPTDVLHHLDLDEIGDDDFDFFNPNEDEIDDPTGGT